MPDDSSIMIILDIQCLRHLPWEPLVAKKLYRERLRETILVDERSIIMVITTEARLILLDEIIQLVVNSLEIFHVS